MSNYSQAVNKIAQAAKSDTQKALATLDLSDIAQARDIIIDTLNVILPAYTDAAATLSASFYNECRRIELGETCDALAESCREPEKTEQAVRAFMQVIVDGGTRDKLMQLICERVDYEIQIAANAAVMYAGEHDKL